MSHEGLPITKEQQEDVDKVISDEQREDSRVREIALNKLSPVAQEISSSFKIENDVYTFSYRGHKIISEPDKRSGKPCFFVDNFKLSGEENEAMVHKFQDAVKSLSLFRNFEDNVKHDEHKAAVDEVLRD